MNPTIIQREELVISGIMGDGNQTTLLWKNFEKKSKELKIKDKADENGYEVRFYYDNKCNCLVGALVKDKNINTAFDTFCLPASEYAIFDVVVANGYDSENEAMGNWLKNKKSQVKNSFRGKVLRNGGKGLGKGVLGKNGGLSQKWLSPSTFHWPEKR